MLTREQKKKLFGLAVYEQIASGTWKDLRDDFDTVVADVVPGFPDLDEAWEYLQKNSNRIVEVAERSDIYWQSKAP